MYWYKKKIEMMMTSEEKNRYLSLGSFLFMISLIYGNVVKIKKAFYEKGFLKPKRLPCSVISIGNLTVGGTGKTPMTAYVAEHVRNLGYKVAVISRGYKGSAEKSGGIVSDGNSILMGPDMAGDEPYMLAKNLKNVPVIVGQNRYRAGKLAIREFNPDVMVMDDAFQHLKLFRDIDLVLLDRQRPFGNAHMLPRGTLREPVSSLSRGHAFIFTRSDIRSESISLKTIPDYIPAGCPVFHTVHTPYMYKLILAENNTVSESPKTGPYNFEFLKGSKAIAFSGIAKNKDFKHTVESFQCTIIKFREFPDHHSYSDNDLEEIIQTAKDSDANFIVTTDKDYVRFAKKIAFPVSLVVLGIKISFLGEDNTFTAFIQDQLAKLRLGDSIL